MHLELASVLARIALFAAALGGVALPARPAAAADCGRAAGDAAAVAALVEQARAACPCASFDGRQAFRDCVRDVVGDAIGGASLPKRCRAAAMRFARKSTCGARDGKVTCCKANGGCAIASSAERCAATGGGSGRVGASESCWDACVPVPTPSPRVTPTPFVPPAPCCACGCRPPYYTGCSGTHQCSAPLDGGTSPAQCDSLDDADKDCAQVFVTCDSDNGGIPYPLCR
jgi:hypothetical protein